MTSETPAFSVDLDQLDDLAARMRGYADAVAERLSELEQKAKEAEAVWAGSAAVAYRQAHTEWVAGVTDMREGLAALEAAVKTAHTGYTDAVTEGRRILGI
ncbi:WXG100 family type VII secretion target [Nocardia bovistercoris]|uniref:ESAT-6-like protein n=1 Tax=Nocardia bovistercoris TaxID=2785916 RepID=A0A931I943_9NOCA|nr:WXG100 family type VII secretion target [Nocardia bovistercoris]MBH0776130.1 WXG100 family type VII secretion target [Nocardia bovistercoris]